MQEATGKYTFSDNRLWYFVNETFADVDKKNKKKQHQDLKTLQTSIKLYRFQVL